MNRINYQAFQKKMSFNPLPSLSLHTIFELFIRPHLDYGNIMYNQAYNALFYQKLKSIKYRLALGVTGAIRETSTNKLYNELQLFRQYLRQTLVFILNSCDVK